MEVNIKVEVPDDFKPYTKNCYKTCPFGELDDEYPNVWSCPCEIYTDEDGFNSVSCIMKEAMDKQDDYEKKIDLFIVEAYKRFTPERQKELMDRLSKYGW